MAGDDDERRGACELPPITPRGGERLVSPRPPSHPPEASSRGGRAVVAGGKFRRDTLELLEERWKNRKAPATRESAAPSPRFFKMSSSPALPLPVSTAVDGDASAWVERQLEQVKLFASTQIASSTQQAESVRIVSKLLVQLKEGKLDAGEKEPSESDAQEHDHEREMAEFQAMMAGNDLEAAEKKLADIIAAAEEDGEIDENEQAQIDQAKEHLRAMQEKKRAAERLQEELERKAAEKAELAALMASNDVKAAEKKLQEIIAAAEEDGEIDEDERKEIERAKDELETLKKKKERLDKKMKTTREQVEVKKLPAHREEKVRISIAAKQTAQERLRLATGENQILVLPIAVLMPLFLELRALKEKYTELATDYKKQISDMEQIEEAFALALIELETSKGMVAEQRRELAEKGQEIESLKKDQDRLKVEVDKYTQLANVRKTQLVELKQAFDSVRAQWEKENNVLSSQLATVSQRMSSVTRELEEERKEKVKLERSSRNNEELARLEKDAAMVPSSSLFGVTEMPPILLLLLLISSSCNHHAAPSLPFRLSPALLQLERTNGDKLRIRCIELDEEIHELVRACARSGIPLTPQQQTRCSQLERELAKVTIALVEGDNSSLKEHLQEAALWHQGEGSTGVLLGLKTRSSSCRATDDEEAADAASGRAGGDDAAGNRGREEGEGEGGEGWSGRVRSGKERTGQEERGGGIGSCGQELDCNLNNFDAIMVAGERGGRMLMGKTLTEEKNS
eukprot:755126-Hanusia_phi.AAC.6